MIQVDLFYWPEIFTFKEDFLPASTIVFIIHY